MKRLIKNNIRKIRRAMGIDISELDDIRVLMGKILIGRNGVAPDHASLKDIEFKVFSQWGEDGIIQFLISRTEIPNKVFVEFGVEDYREANTRFLLINDNWSGLVMDSSRANIAFIKDDDIYWRYDLKAVESFVTRGNIDRMISANLKEPDIGLMAIDVDGNDYWIWKAIETVSPRIVVCEYNGIFGCERAVTVPYDESFNRFKKHYSGLFWGASLGALSILSEEKGYVFVGCNSGGNNAFFIRKDVCRIPPADVRKSFVAPKFRESRNRKMELNYLSGADRIKEISSMEVYDVESKKNVLVGDIAG